MREPWLAIAAIDAKAQLALHPLQKRSPAFGRDAGGDLAGQIAAT